MDKIIIEQLYDKFESLSQPIPEQKKVNFWFARDLQEPLGYSEWRNFEIVIQKAITSCDNSGYNHNDHFVGINKMVTLGSGSQREIHDYMLTRFACYLIAQNGDPRKEQIAFAQSYFAIQTRKQELIESRMKLHARLEARERLRESEKELSQNIYERGVDERGFAIIRSKGDAALFGGKTTKMMKEKYGIVKSRPLADFLPTLTIAAKNLATEMTNHNVTQEDLYGEIDISPEQP